MAPTIVLVSGFLGAGKTTLLLCAARVLRGAGRRVGLITNDQGGELVDTRLLAAEGFRTEEIAGGCFCCRLSAFASSARRLLEARPDVILAEPVGSCTDLSATVLRPLRAHYGARFRIAPLTVLVDPARAAERRDEHADYLFQRQIAEGEILRYTKSDLYPDAPGPALSACTGAGVAEWLEEVLNREGRPRALEIDYRRYAEAEAHFGWLNWRGEVRLARPLTPAAVAGPLLENVAAGLGSAAVAHLKILVEAASGYVKAGICREGELPAVEGLLDAAPARRHRVTVNLRAAAEPALLESAVREAAARVPGRVAVQAVEAFRPAAPRPEHRITENSLAGQEAGGWPGGPPYKENA